MNVNWVDPAIDATVFFPERFFDEDGVFIPAMLQIFFDRYTDPETGLSTVHWHDSAHTQRRNASIYDGSMAPTPVYDPPIGPMERPIGKVPIGRTIRCGWHPLFLEHLRRDPQPEPELFEGVYEITN